MTGWLHSIIWLSPQVMLGGVVSTMVSVWLHVALLEQESVALQTRVMETLTGQITLVTTCSATSVSMTLDPPPETNGGLNRLVSAVMLVGAPSITHSTS